MMLKILVKGNLATLDRNDRRLATATRQRVYWLAQCELCNNLRRNGLSRDRAIALIVEHCLRHHDGSKHEHTSYGK